MNAAQIKEQACVLLLRPSPAVGDCAEIVFRGLHPSEGILAPPDPTEAGGHIDPQRDLLEPDIPRPQGPSREAQEQNSGHKAR